MKLFSLYIEAVNPGSEAWDRIVYVGGRTLYSIA
jgi:hypothetical protein